MLALTERAAEAIQTITGQPGLADDAGLRISSAPQDGDPTGQAAQLVISVVEAPEEEDYRIEEPPIYVEPGNTAEFLDDKVLDAELGEGQVRFAVFEQPTEEQSGSETTI